VLGILLSVFLAMFALDAFSEGKPFVQALLPVLLILRLRELPRRRGIFLACVGASSPVRT
jgi:hypothetical protein